MRNGGAELPIAQIVHRHRLLRPEHHPVVKGDRGDRIRKGIDLRENHKVIAVTRVGLGAVGDLADERPQRRGGGGVRRPGSGGGEEPDRHQVTGQSVGNIGHLRREFRGEGTDHRQAIGLDETKKLASGGKREVGMKEAPRIDVVVLVLVRGKDKEVSARRNDHGGKLPLVEIVGAVGEMPAAEVHRSGAEVVNLDPVGRIPVAVVESRVIAGHELRDDQRGWQFDDLDVEQKDRIRFAEKAGRDGVISRRSDGTRHAGDDPGERIKQQAGRQGRGNRIAVRRPAKPLGRVRRNRHSREVTRGTGRVAGQS